MTEKKVFIIIGVVVVLLVGTSAVILGSSPVPTKITTSQNASIATANTSYDWGYIQYNSPKAIKGFKIKNNGTESLKIGKVKTSCSCTTAQVIIGNNKSPLFSMHGGSNWVGEVKPGKEASLEIIFDQTFHGPSGIGPFERYITIETNDASKPKLEFYLKGIVVKS
ncbi:hypothetical protein A2690_01775 [Candidatus Roizmanbacteria bacterium RIFCSPHIGHO2_01_FULL_39_12b]|uniref:DUF1573 domain-containing protein n=1 Tax=Candidatus Roizmanbacteria bacterium RIFCSPHIGHO2_01_FULL_39_12b TaxID=1802030 RepID=A0A1F7GB91_9BACT|nr:MAG: hypothetical protein A2690_01775 [Candidatus Roizmanbacteria bacterium RIFCSPHIGHO2_01_FULL_39_12b]OGK46150.1 MAG: hypothetical protein A3B46_03020 [Candidatus Roizmanbacteria bacterium RIFCSPLOWO2_01_FULL_39_19]